MNNLTNPKNNRIIPGTFSGPVLSALGGAGLAIFGGISVGLGFAGALFGMPGLFTGAAIAVETFSIPLTAFNGFLFFRGNKTSKRVKRIREYLDICQGKTFMMLSDLSRESGQPVKKIKEDLAYLMDRNFLPGVRMDQEETCLLLTDEAIRLYDAAKQSQHDREEEERKKKEEMEHYESLSSEEKDRIDFFRKAKEALNQVDYFAREIDDPQMKPRISRLSLALSRIFVCIREHPEKMRSAGRLMNYYVPTILKLLSVYEDLEKQPIQGDNIKNSLKDIEESLDTMNDALENMFDELFQAEAFDVSTDIEVLRAMLKKDGLDDESIALQSDVI